jgi:hypothetical protein
LSRTICSRVLEQHPARAVERVERRVPGPAARVEQRLQRPRVGARDHEVEVAHRPLELGGQRAAEQQPDRHPADQPGAQPLRLDVGHHAVRLVLEMGQHATGRHRAHPVTNWWPTESPRSRRRQPLMRPVW